MIGVSTPESGNGCVSAAVFPAFRQILREGRPQSMKRWPVAAAVLAACLTGCAGETTATVNPQTQALERAEQAGLLREEEKKPQLLSVYEAQKLAGEQFDSESYAVAPSRETLECEIEGETHSFAVFDVSRRADGGAVGQVAVDRVTGDRYRLPITRAFWGSMTPFSASRRTRRPTGRAAMPPPRARRSRSSRPARERSPSRSRTA